MAPTSMAKIAAGRYVERLEAENNRLRAALHRNACRYQPELTHDEIDAEIARIVRGADDKDNVDKARAWDAIAVKNAEIERLRAALKGIAEYCSTDGSPLGAIARLTAIRNTADRVLAHEQRGQPNDAR